MAVVERDGGVRVNPYVDQHDVVISVWAATWAEAMVEANRLAGAVCRLPSTAGTATQWRATSITALPYSAPDPTHQDIPRVQLTAAVICRTTI